MSSPLDPALPTLAAQELLRSWDTQQSAYITGREARFDIMLDALAAVLEPGDTVIDLACGPGSLTKRVLDRFTEVSVVGVDYDPLLLDLGRHAMRDYQDRLQLIDVDLANPAWIDSLPTTKIRAVVSSTALHWLPAATLTRLYQQLAQLISPMGIFLNADHLRFDDGRSLFTQLSAADDRRTQELAAAAGALTWDQWFEHASAAGPWAANITERERRFADRPRNPDLSVDFHLDTLRISGFDEAGTIWQYLDDYVILARR